MKPIILFITCVMANIVCFGQADTLTVPVADTTPVKSTLTVGAVYANNASYYGQKAEEKTPYVAMAATYRLKAGFYFSGLAYKLLNEKTSGISAGSLGGGVGFKLGTRLSADINYNHTFFAGNSPLLQAGNPDNASVALTYENWLNVAITGDYAFGKSNDGFVTGALSKSINLFSIGKKDIISISPSADVVAGTQHFYQVYQEEKKLRDSLLGNVLGPITGNPPSGNPSKTVATTSFKILSYNFKLPLAYNRAHYVIEANYQLSVLSNNVESGSGKTNSFVTLSFYYQF